MDSKLAVGELRVKGQAAPQNILERAAAGRAAAASQSAGRVVAAGSSTSGGVVEQWATRLLAFSSQFSAADNSASQLIGQPAVFPAAGSHPRAWSPIPRAGEATEWVQVGFSHPVRPTAVYVLQTLRPGAVIRIRATLLSTPSELQSANWRELWVRIEGTEVVLMGQAAELFVSLTSGTMDEAVNAIEVELSTEGWGEEVWSEIDAIRLDGIDASSDPGRRDLGKQPWETERDYNSRVGFVISRFGSLPPTDPAASMRQAALSMVHSNMRLMGCRYPETVEQLVGGAHRQGLGSGFAFDGQMAATRALRGGR